MTPGVSLDTQLCAPLTRLPFSQKPFFLPSPPSAAAVVGSLVKSENYFSEKPKKKKKKKPVIIIKKISHRTRGFPAFSIKKERRKYSYFYSKWGAVWVRRESIEISVGAKNGDPKERKLSLESRKRMEKRVLGRKYQMYSGFRTGVITPPPFPNLINAKKGEGRNGEFSLSLSFVGTPIDESARGKIFRFPPPTPGFPKFGFSRAKNAFSSLTPLRHISGTEKWRYDRAVKKGGIIVREMTKPHLSVSRKTFF